MRAFHSFLLVVVVLGIGLLSATAQVNDCPARPESGTLVGEPASLQSQNGVLTIDLTLSFGIDKFGYPHYCYIDQTASGPIEAPTLRLNPGDQLVLNLTNQISGNTAGAGEMAGMNHASHNVAGDPCGGGTMTAASTNVHFHGLNIPPICHQDDIINTIIQPNDPPFQYSIQIPRNEPPGLYWYHPHPHGFTTTQVAGGASGALIVEGIEKVRPEVAGLRERIVLLRQQFPANGGLAGDEGPYQMTINLQPAALDEFPLPYIEMDRNQPEFWRVLNASTTEFMVLQVQYGQVAQTVEMIALDGVPLLKTVQTNTITLPPAGRAEFIVPGLPDNAFGQLITLGADTGPLGDLSLPQKIANIKGSDLQAAGVRRMPGTSMPAAKQRFANLEFQNPTATRSLYFSESAHSAYPNAQPAFFITVDGQDRRIYTPDEPPAVTTHVGAVEDWTIENRSQELHAFHIHQIHFLVLEVNGKPARRRMQDTLTIPYWKGKGPYPSVKVRMDFRDPEIAGMFVYHCHILDHEDGGMMANILVKPK